MVDGPLREEAVPFLSRKSSGSGASKSAEAAEYLEEIVGEMMPLFSLSRKDAGDKTNSFWARPGLSPALTHLGKFEIVELPPGRE